jgi:hypothetical protein
MVELFMILPAKGKTIKAGEQPDPGNEERQKQEGHVKHTKHLDFQLHNPLKFKREGSRKKLGWLHKIH